MKKQILFGLLLLFLSSVAFSQSSDKNYIDGYEDLPWGLSVSSVQEKYPQIHESNMAETQKGESLYLMKSGTVTRAFRFYDDKLYWVRVIYDDMSQTQFNALTEKLIAKYGSLFLPVDSTESIEFGYEWLFLLSDMNLSLTVNSDRNGFGAKIGQYVVVTYSSSSIETEMKKAAIDDIEL